MAKLYILKIENNGPIAAMNDFFRRLLKERVIEALLVPQESAGGNAVIQTLVKNEDEIKNASPFAPLLLLNSAKIVSQLTRDNAGAKIGAVMRSCEIRAAVELAKLKQADFENLIVIGVDCLGTYESGDYQKAAARFKSSKELTHAFLSGGLGAEAGIELRLACRGCEYPNPANTDMAINFLGCDVNKEIFIQLSGKLEALDAEKFNLSPAGNNDKWTEASRACREKRMKFRDSSFQEALGGIKDIGNFMKEFEHCRKCYNCRKECPVCYCRECIFDSLLFEHEPAEYLNWASKKGRIRMPSDTLLFHLTRMNHMVISCVGCGQCTSACPHGIPVAKFFKAVGSKVQQLFDYEPGRSIKEENPQSMFREDEFIDFGSSGGGPAHVKKQ